VLLARDHFGVKPLYYIQRGRQLAFASEVKALLELPDFAPRVDEQALHQYLTFLWVPDPRTMFRGVAKMPAGHRAVFAGGRLDVAPYWDLELPPQDAEYRTPQAELIGQIQDRFSRAVKSQMVSDVPLGAFLSAGLDSSAIVAMLAGGADRPVDTFTITFPSRHRIGENAMDDPAIARRTASRFGCRHHEIVVDPKVADLLPRLVWHMDEPVADPPIMLTYLIARAARQAGITVLLSGVGGDELFAGYRKHAAHRWAERYRHLPQAVRRGLVEPAIDALPGFRGTPLHGPVRMAKKMARGGSLPPRDRFLMASTYFDASEKVALYTRDLACRIGAIDPWSTHLAHFDRVGHADFVNRMLYLDTKTFMPSLNLTYTDKMSMAASVEVRVPFLDRQLAEYAAVEVPPHLKVTTALRPATKYIFRESMKGILPDEVLTASKAGFSAPVDHWLTHDLRDMVGDLLGPARVKARGFFEPPAVQRLIAEHRAGKPERSMQLWQLLTFELWLQAFVDQGQAGQMGQVRQAG
jgi:asparagine synthase (glutamine-hydrolysing)